MAEYDVVTIDSEDKVQIYLQHNRFFRFGPALTTLNLRGPGIKLDEAKMKILARALDHFGCNITSLDLSGSLTGESLTHLIPALMNPACSIKELNLSRNSWHNKSMRLLWEALKLASCGLTTLALSDMTDVRSSDWHQMFIELRQFRITTLNLSHNGLRDYVVPLFESLQFQTGAITSLDLSHNNIDDKRAIALADALASPAEPNNDQTLSVLNLSSNPIGNTGKAALSRVLDDYRCSLSEICLGDISRVYKKELVDDSIDFVSPLRPELFLRWQPHPCVSILRSCWRTSTFSEPIKRVCLSVPEDVGYPGTSIVLYIQHPRPVMFKCDFKTGKWLWAQPGQSISSTSWYSVSKRCPDPETATQLTGTRLEGLEMTLIKLLNNGQAPWYIVGFHVVASILAGPMESWRGTAPKEIIWFLRRIESSPSELRNRADFMRMELFLFHLLTNRLGITGDSFCNKVISNGTDQVSAVACARKLSQIVKKLRLRYAKSGELVSRFLDAIQVPADNVLDAANALEETEKIPAQQRFKSMLRFAKSLDMFSDLQNSTVIDTLLSHWEAPIDQAAIAAAKVFVTADSNPKNIETVAEYLDWVPHPLSARSFPKASGLVKRYREIITYILGNDSKIPYWKPTAWQRLALTFETEDEKVAVAGKEYTKQQCLLKANSVYLSLPGKKENVAVTIASAGGSQHLVPTSCSRALDWWADLAKGNKWLPVRPSVIALFGPPGTGKNEMVRRFARQLWAAEGKRYPFDNFYKEYNMSMFTTEHSISILMGTVPGVQGGIGALTRAIRPDADPSRASTVDPEHVLRVLYLDEFMLANDKIKQTLGGFFEDGKFEDQSGANARCKLPFFVFLSSNPKDPTAEELRQNSSAPKPLTLCNAVMADPLFKACENQENLFSQTNNESIQTKLQDFRTAMFGQGLDFMGDRCLRVYVAAAQTSKEYHCEMFRKFLHEAGRQWRTDYRVGWTDDVVAHFYKRYSEGDWRGKSARNLRNLIQVLLFNLLKDKLVPGKLYIIYMKTDSLLDVHEHDPTPALWSSLSMLDEFSDDSLYDIRPQVADQPRSARENSQLNAVAGPSSGSSSSVSFQVSKIVEKDLAAPVQQDANNKKETLANPFDFFIGAIVMALVVVLLKIM